MKYRIFGLFIFLSIGSLLSCSKNPDYTSQYEFPTILVISGSDNLSSGNEGFTAKYYTYYLGKGITYNWTTSSPDDLEIISGQGTVELTVKFKPSSKGKKITINVKSSNGIIATKVVTVS